MAVFGSFIVQDSPIFALQYSATSVLTPAMPSPRSGPSAPAISLLAHFSPVFARLLAQREVERGATTGTGARPGEGGAGAMTRRGKGGRRQLGEGRVAGDDPERGG